MNVINKIKKLLRLSKSPFEAEAQLALERAFELAAKYQVDIETLDLDEDLNRIVVEGIHAGYRISLARKLALGIVKSFFNVFPVIAHPHVKFVGTAADIKIAQYVWNFLAHTCDEEVKRVTMFSGGRLTVVRRRSFIIGFFYGIASKLDGAKERLFLSDQQVALIVASKELQRRAVVDEQIGKTQLTRARQPRRMQKDYLHHGYIRGRATIINPACDAAAAREQLSA